MTDQLASLYGDETIPSLEDDRRAAIVAGGEVSPVHDHSPSWPRIGLVLAIAAGLLLMLGVAPMMYRQQQEAKQVTMTGPMKAGELVETSLQDAVEETRRKSARMNELSVAGESVDWDASVSEMLLESSESSSASIRVLAEKRLENLSRVSGESPQPADPSLNSRGVVSRSITSPVAASSQPVKASDLQSRLSQPSEGLQFSAPVSAAAPAPFPVSGKGLDANADEAKLSGPTSVRDRSSEMQVEFVEEGGRSCCRVVLM